MSIAELNEMTDILNRIRALPVPSRITLARHILESVEGKPVVEPMPRRQSLSDLIGLLKTESLPPTDEECRAILENELIRKHSR